MTDQDQARTVAAFIPLFAAILKARAESGSKYGGGHIFVLQDEECPQFPDDIAAIRLPAEVPAPGRMKYGIDTYHHSLKDLPKSFQRGRYAYIQFSPGLQALMRAQGLDPKLIWRYTCNLEDIMPFVET